MADTTPEDAKQVSKTRIILPMLFSIGISAYLIAFNFKPAALGAIHFTPKLLLGLVLALVALLVRDAAFVYKVRLSSGEKLSWRRALTTVIMWEFGAAITPKIGEVAFTLFVLKRSGLTFGRSTGVVVLNAFLDSAVFSVVFGILYLFMGHHILFVQADCADLAGDSLVQRLILEVRHLAENAWIGYAFFCAGAVFLGIALFALPQTAKRFFYALGRMKFLKRFQHGINHLGDEIEITAREYKNQTWWFWIRMTTATLINWVARYSIVNALVFAFAVTTTPNMLEVFARQYVLWIFLVIPTTPGASGWAEISFIALNCEFMPVGLSAAIALVWRIYTYYLYLLVGVTVLPGWLKNTVASASAKIESSL
jgi:uncharacterized membrane protein YbhN (UPF0104 family)